MQTQISQSHSTWWDKLKNLIKVALLYGIPAITAIIGVTANCIAGLKLKGVEENLAVKTLVDGVSGVTVPALLSEILMYLVLERFAVLKHLPTEKSLRETIETTLASPSQVEIHATPHETYSEAKSTIDRVGGTVEGQKQMLHGSPSPPGNRMKLSEESHLRVFDAKIDDCVLSRGPRRWHVRHFYNIATLERLAIVEKRVRVVTDGYEVRAIFIPDLMPCFSPLIVGEEDAFLAIVDSVNYRVGASIHLRGQEATKFVVKYFDLLWDHKGVYRLRGEDGIREDEFRRLREDIAKGRY